MSIIAKYKFDHNTYADLVPVFNDEYTGYSISDEVAEDGSYTIRTIECDSLPTMMRFGCDDSNTKTSREESLLEVLDLNTSNLNTMLRMFMYCSNLKFLPPFSDIGTTTSLMYMCYGCSSLTELNLADVKFNDGMVLHQICMDCSSLINLELPIENFYVSDMLSMMSNCTSLKFLNLSNLILSSSDANCSSFINNCWELTTLDISNLNTNQDVITGDCGKLKYVKCNIPLTIQTISSQLSTRTSDDPGTIIYQGAETLSSDVITELNSKGWNVVTSPTLIAKYKYDSTIYKNLIPVFNDGYMGFVEDEEVDENGIVTRVIEHVELPTQMRFGYTNGEDNVRPNALTELLNINISNLTTCYRMFNVCKNLTYINPSIIWSHSKTISTNAMFLGCSKLKNVDFSKFTLSSSSISYMFQRCDELEEIDLSNVTFEKTTTMIHTFRNLPKLKKLDISNANLSKITDDDDAFASIPSLTDIGMIYCYKETVNKVASLLPTDVHRTIWVESDDILQYDQYDHITYKTQKVQDTVHLNSPLLKGDTIEVIDGKTYHVHRYEKVVLDGSENWTNITNYDIENYTCFTSTNCIINSNKGFNTPSKLESDRFLAGSYGSNYVHEAICVMDAYKGLRIKIDKTRLTSPDVNGFKQWLSENPTTVVYTLDVPYYELISEEPLELTLLDTADNTINNNSILPSNMTIANKELSTIAIKPSTTYTLSFDKSNEDSEVTIDICDGEQITTVLNRVELTTPSELGSGIRFISSDGCIVSNVRLLEGSLVESAIPEETFEGLQSSFDEGYIIGENLLGSLYHVGSYYVDNGEYYTLKLPAGNGQPFISYNVNNIEPGKTYTIIYNVDVTQGIIHTCFMNANNSSVTSNEIIVQTSGRHIQLLTANAESKILRILNRSGMDANFNFYKDIIVLEGDHTHLSEAELMRYIEKGTSHYEEEDYNHVGKYKVEYKVTGKNKFNIDADIIDIVNANISNNDNGILTITPIDKTKNTAIDIAVKIPKGTYFYTGVATDATQFRKDNIILYNLGNKTNRVINLSKDIDSMTFNWLATDESFTFDFNSIQIEESTVATEYEPYKEDVKTCYLSSPLLEGDTIEDVNGVATHVKRYGKVVLDGSENWNSFTINPYNHTNVNKVQLNFSHSFVYQAKCNNTPWYSNYPLRKLAYDTNSNIHFYFEPVLATFFIDKSITSLDDWKSRLKERPMELVCQLASPIYEPISTESILLDSYTNGHLDLSNENIPIQKTEFRNFTKELAYLQPSTDYIVRFSSDNIGIAKVYLDSSVKEINVVKGINEVIITTPSTIVNNNIIIDGIGFNVSNVQVIADVIKDGDIKDFDYFKGLQSSFEDGLVTDENDENYGKYKVECKIVGKNKWHLGDLYFDVKTIRSDGVTPLLKKGVYTLSCDTSIEGASIRFMDNSNKEISWVLFVNRTLTLKEDIYTIHLYSKNWSSSLSEGNFVTINNIQLEEGTQATEYEPYKESIHTLYLNSPLLKDDKLVVHEGKLCHYHKMGMVVLDGSEHWEMFADIGKFYSRCIDNYAKDTSISISDKFANRLSTGDTIKIGGGLAKLGVHKLDKYSVSEFKQWLQANPTTVVYELAEPYYEPIEPQISQYSFSTVKDGDMEIITALPIEIDLTYRTDINGVSSIEEQIASIQESTDISNIIDEEVDE